MAAGKHFYRHPNFVGQALRPSVILDETIQNVIRLWQLVLLGSVWGSGQVVRADRVAAARSIHISGHRLADGAGIADR